MALEAVGWGGGGHAQCGLVDTEINGGVSAQFAIELEAWMARFTRSEFDPYMACLETGNFRHLCVPAQRQCEQPAQKAPHVEIPHDHDI